MRARMLSIMLAGLAACGEEPREDVAAKATVKVATSGKMDVALADVPPQVLAAAQAARPGFVPASAESETREGRRYFDVEGRLPAGTEIEFDIMEENGDWRVVETQRDIAFAAVPEPVRAAALAHERALAPTRVIESVQSDGLVIFEIYQDDRKIEVKWNGRTAEVLAREWAH